MIIDEAEEMERFKTFYYDSHGRPKIYTEEEIWLAKAQQAEDDENTAHDLEIELASALTGRLEEKLRRTQNLLDDQIKLAEKLQRNLADANVFADQLSEMLRVPSMIRFYSNRHLEVFSEWTGRHPQVFLSKTIQENIAKAHEAFKKATE